MPLIRYITPYALDGNLADAMNLEMELAPAGSYVAFMDRDTWMCHPKFGHLIHECIEKHGEAYYTCLTNRTNCAWQRVDAIPCDGGYHVDLAEKIWKEYEGEVRDGTREQLWSGHLMVCPKDLWTPLKVKGLLGVDNQIHRNAQAQGAKVYLMPVYMWHYYSGYDGTQGHKERDKSHLI